MIYDEIQKSFINGLFAIPFGALGFFLTSELAERRKNRMSSKIGFYVLSGLIEEISTGIYIMESFEQTQRMTRANMPSTNWIGVNTISDEILLRIIETTKNRDNSAEIGMIRNHCKNYFSNIVVTWNNNIESFYDPDSIMKEDKIQYALRMVSDSHFQFLMSSRFILGLLIAARSELLINSKRRFPK